MEINLATGFAYTTDIKQLPKIILKNDLDSMS